MVSRAFVTTKVTEVEVILKLAYRSGGHRDETIPAIVADGPTRAIGVRNFDVEYLSQILTGARIQPAVNQCCFCVGDNATIAFGNRHGVTYQSYSPLGAGDSGGKSILDLPAIKAVAADHPGRLTAQIALRWLVQQGAPFVSATGRGTDITEDRAVFDFELTAGEMARLNSLHHSDGLAK